MGSMNSLATTAPAAAPERLLLDMGGEVVESAFFESKKKKKKKGGNFRICFQVSPILPNVFGFFSQKFHRFLKNPKCSTLVFLIFVGNLWI